MTIARSLGARARRAASRSVWPTTTTASGQVFYKLDVGIPHDDLKFLAEDDAMVASALAFEEFPVGKFRPKRDMTPVTLLGLNAWNNEELARRGGMTLAGGRGSIIGVLGGVLIVGLINNIMTLLGGA